jgi:PEP-CTERM motif
MHQFSKVQQYLGVVAIALAASSAQALVIDHTNIGVGTSGVDGNGFESFASGIMDTKLAGPYTGVGVAGGRTNGEIDIGTSTQQAEFITLNFDQEQIVSSFRIGLLYNGPEYGDVKEVARITADDQIYYLRATSTEGVAQWLDSSWSLLSTVRYEYGTIQGAGAVINMVNPFGSTLIGSLTFEAVRGTCYSGWCNNQSDYNLVNVTTVTPVPEPSTYALMLAGLGAVAWIARRRRPQ